MLRLGLLAMVAGCYSAPDYGPLQFKCDPDHSCPAGKSCACGQCVAPDAEQAPFVANNYPVTGMSGAKTTAPCDPGLALMRDGAAAGLSYVGVTPNDFTLFSVGVTSCLELGFQPIVDAGCLHINWTRDNACGATCLPGDCETPTNAPVFRSGPTATGLLTAPDLPAVNGTFEDVFLPLDAATSLIIVCRGGWGNGRADVLVDSVGIIPM